MKITHIITGLAADGAETTLYHLLAALDRQEYQNEVISLTDRGATADRGSRRALRRNDGRIAHLG